MGWDCVCVALAACGWSRESHELMELTWLCVVLHMAAHVDKIAKEVR